MRVPYFPEAPSLAVINEIKYYMVLSVLKKMLCLAYIITMLQ